MQVIIDHQQCFFCFFKAMDEDETILDLKHSSSHHIAKSAVVTELGLSDCLMAYWYTHFLVTWQHENIDKIDIYKN